MYIARKVEGPKQLYSIPIGGGEATKLNEHLLDGGDVFWFLISPDNNLVAYVSEVETNGVRDLFTVPIHGGQAINLTPPLGGGGTINSWDTCADGQHVVYVADWEEINLYALYVSLKAYQLFVPFIAGS